jgi:hypothetical protein
MAEKMSWDEAFGLIREQLNKVWPEYGPLCLLMTAGYSGLIL